MTTMTRSNGAEKRRKSTTRPQPPQPSPAVLVKRAPDTLTGGALRSHPHFNPLGGRERYKSRLVVVYSSSLACLHETDLVRS
ncbi:hypothetical protein ACOMHN_027791 [Nucella lapillus]